MTVPRRPYIYSGWRHAQGAEAAPGHPDFLVWAEGPRPSDPQQCSSSATRGSSRRARGPPDLGPEGAGQLKEGRSQRRNSLSNGQGQGACECAWKGWGQWRRTAVRYSISRVLKAGQGLAESPGWPSRQEKGRRGVWGGDLGRGGASKAKDSARQVASTRDDEAGSSGARSREGGVME